MQNEIAQQQTSDPVPTPYRAIITDSNQYLAISTKDDIEEKNYLMTMNMLLVWNTVNWGRTIRIFKMDLEREVWRTAVLHFGWERIEGLKDVGSET